MIGWSHSLRRSQLFALALMSSALVLAALVLTSSLTHPTERAAAATASAFQDGNIISDENFFDAGSMSAAEVQNFLNSQVTGCAAANGQPCLKDFSQDTQTRDADAYCGTMPGGRMTAAQIIVAAAKACGISPRVLIVMLQKEQGLITASSPSSWAYEAALGQSCPDTAACDPRYSGFFNQVFFGARQLKMYVLMPQWYAYQLGWNNILYSPDRSCGTKNVYIQNNATRALYIYTPYTPNQAALNNLYGTGDSCSTYGNRNFWRLYTDWFGDPTVSYPVLGEMAARWQAIGGSSSVIGVPIANEVCNWTPGRVNCYQNFRYGAISWTPTTGAWETYGDIRSLWSRQAFENGPLGYPTAAPVNTPGRAYQTFQGGTIGWSSSGGAFTVTGDINVRWLAIGATTGSLGSPLGEVACGTKDGGCYQNFQGGAISWTSATGAWETYGDIRSLWSRQAFENGPLGYPTAAPVNTPGRAYQTFQGGTIGWSSSGGAFTVTGDINVRWLALGATTGPLGYPTGAQVCGTKDGGCYQNFQGGAISWTSATGAWETYGDIRAYWGSRGYENGTLGYPTGAVTANEDGLSQQFQGGTVRWNRSTGAVS